MSHDAEQYHQDPGAVMSAATRVSPKCTGSASAEVIQEPRFSSYLSRPECSPTAAAVIDSNATRMLESLLNLCTAASLSVLS